MNTSTILFGDCRYVLQTLDSNSIDACITDPPYFLDKMDNTWNPENLNPGTNTTIIRNLPAGMKFSKQQGQSFYDFYLDVSKKIYRVLKPGAFFLSFSSPRLYHRMCCAVEDSGFEIRDTIAWLYKQSQVKAFSQDHIINNDKNFTPEQKKDLIQELNEFRTPQLKPSMELICFAQKPCEGRYIDNWIKYNVGLINSNQKLNNGIFPTNTLSDELSETYFMIKKPSKKEKGKDNNHPSVKPVDLLIHLINLITPPNAIVLDPFLGSGTTAIACQQTNRKWIGIEINQEYIDIANKRLNNII